jgi:hypothetical protein
MKLKIVALAVLAAVSGATFANDGRVVRVPFDENGQPITNAGFLVTPAPTQPVAATNPAPVPGVAVAIPNSQASVKRLSAVDRKRLDAVREWERTGVAEALVGANGSIEYPYGYSRPVISCAPLHICTIVLQPGEPIVSLAGISIDRWQQARGCG